MRSRFEPRFGDVAMIILAAIVFFAPTIDDYWVKDDLLLGNFTDGDGTELSARAVRHYLWPTTMEREQFWRPAAMLAGFGDYLIWGANPAGFHVGNVLLHALNGVLLYLLANRLTGFRSPAVGLAAGLAFVLSPINVEAVAWLLQRMVLLSATFSLLALLAWLKAAEGGGRRWRVAGLALLALALLSKEVAIVLPGVFFLIDVLYGPRGGRGGIGVALRRTLSPALLLIAYLGCRYLLWGRFDLRYAGMEPMEYARHNRVFERLPATLLHCLAPINAAIFADPWRLALRGAFALAGGAAILRAVVLLFSGQRFGRAAIVGLGLAALGLLPTLLAFFVRDDLFNARFFYLPGAAVAAVVASALWLPRRDETSGAQVGRRRMAWFVSSVWLGASAIGLVGQVQAWGDGAAQVRRTQVAILEHAAGLATDGGPVVIVAFNTPETRNGVPTIENHLDPALRPPLGRPGVRGVALLATLGIEQPVAWAEELERFHAAAGLPWSRYAYVFCEYQPPGITPAFPALAGARGEAAPTLLAPEDGLARRNTAAAPIFEFAAPAGVHHFRLAIDSNEGRSLRIGVTPGRNAERRDDRVRYDLAAGDPDQPALAGLWELSVRQRLPRPLCLVWRVEAYDASDRLLGVSAERRLVILDALPKR
ncbi:MAG: hypothetical protein R3F20_00530 [Planctomycetota bacterium]